MNKIYFGLLLIAFIWAIPWTGNAQTPQYFKGGGTGSNSYPFSSTAGLKTQHLYLPGDLPGAGSGVITRIYFRTVTANATASFTDFYLKLGQTTATQFPGSGLTFATGLTDVVYGATYTVNTANSTSGDWFYIDLQNPFAFDSTQSLILEVVWTTKTAGGFNVRTSSGPSAPNNKRLTSNSATATTGSASANWMDFGIELGNPLNMTLLNFLATAKGNNVNLRWKTANESDVFSYDVERSEDGMSYHTVGSLSAKTGNGSGADYEFTDANAFNDGASSFYYRLKANGKGNKKEYSKVVRVISEEANSAESVVFPNPFTENIFVSVYANSNTKASFQVADMTGRCLINMTNELQKGKNIAPIPQMSNLPPGYYLLTVVSEGNTTVHQILKK
ncbi:MAG TPA: T9SS type A sorting domain-containing protein [Flavipsychrobacter sp.]|nr:T9SS type A sorting domain-containing protein [Flavipsychrobacter sp.]